MDDKLWERRVFHLLDHNLLATLNMICSVTCYMGLRNAIFIYCTFHILPTNVKLVV